MVLEVLMAASALAAVPNNEPVVWKIDPNHSELTFRVRHFVTKVPGTFRTWEGTIVADPENLSGGTVEVTIQTASVDTKNDRRDTHLKSADFFAADSFPTLSFKSSKVEVNGADIRLSGDLTMRGVTRPVVLAGEYAGLFGKPEPNQQRIGFSATTKVNRLDWGIRYNRVIEGSNFLGDDVEITITIEAVRQ